MDFNAESIGRSHIAPQPHREVHTNYKKIKFLLQYLREWQQF